jgi:hypothetical protein
MLTFFRKIRKLLLDSGAATKFLLYAIGEIALGLIGILIALHPPERPSVGRGSIIGMNGGRIGLMKNRFSKNYQKHSRKIVRSWIVVFKMPTKRNDFTKHNHFFI